MTPTDDPIPFVKLVQNLSWKLRAYYGYLLENVYN